MKEINFLKIYKKPSDSKIIKMIYLILIIVTILNLILTARKLIDVYARIELLGEEIDRKENIIYSEDIKNNKDIVDVIISDKDFFTKNINIILSNIPQNTYFKRIYIDPNINIIEGEGKYREDIFLFRNNLKEYNYNLEYIDYNQEGYFKYIIEKREIDDKYE